MKNINTLKKTTIALALAICMMIPATTSTVVAAEQDNNINVDKTFIPLRCSIPSYLIQYSGVEGSTIKKIWAKFLYENKFWDAEHPSFYDSNYSSWHAKYGDKYISILDGVEKNLKDIPNDKSIMDIPDFEAAFGATIKNNPDFLGELLQLPGYEKISNNAEGNNYLTQLVVDLLSTPEAHPNFARFIVELTNTGQYMDLVKNPTNSFGAALLTTISYFYNATVTDAPILSDVQLDYINQSEEYLYDQYVTSPDNSVAAKNASIYNMIARSTYASNNRGQKGQEFFDYVEKSETGMGEWINQIEGVSIDGIEQIGSLSTIFSMSNGYCFGHETEDNCCSHYDCLSVSEKGFATELDNLAYLIHKNVQKNDLLAQYIVNNTNINSLYQINDDSWLAKYTARHDKTGAAQYYTEIIEAGSGGNDEASNSVAYPRDITNVEAICDSYFTVSSKAFTKNAQSITISYTCTSEGDIYSYNVYTNNGTVTNRCPRINNTVDISDLTWEERQHAKIVFKIRAKNIVKYTPPDPTYTNINDMVIPKYIESIAKVQSDPRVTVTCKKPDCVLMGHNWQTNNSKIEWAPDMKTATIFYSCSKDSSHVSPKITLPVKKFENDKQIIYTVSTDPYMYKMVPRKSEKGGYLRDKSGRIIYQRTTTPDSYSKVVLKNAKGSSETIILNESNTTGQTDVVNFSNKPHSYLSSLFPKREFGLYNYSEAQLNFSTKPGLINPGARSLSYTITAGHNFTGSKVSLYSQYGELLYSIKSTTNDITIPLLRFSDSQLSNCTIRITGETHTRTTHRTYSAVPPIATAHIKVDSITINY